MALRFLKWKKINLEIRSVCFEVAGFSLLPYPSRPWVELREGSHAGNRRSLLSADMCAMIHLDRVLPAVGRVCAPNTAVVAKQGARQVACVAKLRRQNPHAVADVGLDVEQIARRTSPFSGVEWHHLHQAAGTDTTRRRRLETRILGEQHTDEEHRSEIRAPTFADQRGRDALRSRAIGGVSRQHACDARDVRISNRVPVGKHAPLAFDRFSEHKVENFGECRLASDDDCALQADGIADVVGRRPETGTW